MQNVTRLRIADVLRRRQTLGFQGLTHASPSNHEPVKQLLNWVIILIMWLQISNEDCMSQASAYEIQFQNSPNGRYRYELHWLDATFTGAMATCQSLGKGHGVLTPLATDDEIETVVTLLSTGCYSRSAPADKVFFIGLTTLGSNGSLNFLDRPRPGSSTALLRAVVIPGIGFVNGSWPDDWLLRSTDGFTDAVEAQVLSSAQLHPLCAAIRPLLASPGAVTEGPTSGAAAAATTLPSHTSACGTTVSQTHGGNGTIWLELNFMECLSQDGDAMHPFVCRVPSPTAQPWPSPVPAPAPQPPPSRLQPSHAALPPHAELTSQPAHPPPSLNGSQPSQEVNDNNIPYPMTTPLLPPSSNSTTRPRPRQAPPPSPAPPVPRAVSPYPGILEPEDTQPIATSALSEAVVLPKCDSEVLDIGTAATRYLACHVAANWYEAAELCGILLPGGSLAVVESQVQLATVSSVLGAKDLGGFFDFWFGLASGASLKRPTREEGPPLEYVLSDPWVAPTFPAQLWTSGALRVHSSCSADPEPPLPSQPPTQQSVSESLPQTLAPAANSIAPSSPLEHLGAASQSPPMLPTPMTTPRPSELPSQMQPPPATALPSPSRDATRTPPSRPSPQPPLSADAGDVLPLPSGCCASLTILSEASGLGSATAGLPQLRACKHRIKFICQAPVDDSTIVVPTPGMTTGAEGGATTLLLGLFLDALDASYLASYRTYRAQLELRLMGTSYSLLSGGDGNSRAVERLSSEMLKQLAQTTQLPARCFQVLQLGPTGSGSEAEAGGGVVAVMNLTVRALPRATLSNFTELIATSLQGRSPGDLLGSDFRSTWLVQDCAIKVLTLEELSELPPAAPQQQHGSRLMILLGAVVGGGMLGIAALGLVLLIRRRRQQRRRGALQYLSGSLTSLDEHLPPPPLAMLAEPSLKSVLSRPPPLSTSSGHLTLMATSLATPLSARPPSRPLSPSPSPPSRPLLPSPSQSLRPSSSGRLGTSWQIPQQQQQPQLPPRASTGLLTASSSGRFGEGSLVSRQSSRALGGLMEAESRVPSELAVGVLSGGTAAYGVGDENSRYRVWRTATQMQSTNGLSPSDEPSGSALTTVTRGSVRPGGLDVFALGLRSKTGTETGLSTPLSREVHMPNSPAVDQAMLGARRSE